MTPTFNVVITLLRDEPIASRDFHELTNRAVVKRVAHHAGA